MPTLLADEFTTPQAAPLATPRTCEPGPGTLDLSGATDLAIAGGKLSVAVSAEDYVRSGSYWDRSVGLAQLISVALSAGGGMYVSFSNNTSTGPEFFLPSYPNWIGTGGFSATQIEFALVLTAWGFFVINRTTGKLTWADVSSGHFNKPVYALFRTGGDTFSVDYWRVLQLGAPWNTDYGLATNRVESPANPQATTSLANAIVTFTWIPAANETLELDVRRTDADNRWIVRCAQAGGTIKLIERNAAVETERQSAAQTWTVGTGYRIAAIMDGNSIQLIVNGGAIAGAYNSASFNNTATGVNVAGFVEGGDLVAWPRDVSAYSFDPGEAIGTTYIPTLTRAAVAPPGSVPAGTLCVSPTGNAAGDGSPANPYDLATGLANLANGGTLLLLDGIYTLAEPPAITYLGKEWQSLQTTVKAQTGARPILTTASGIPPKLVARARTTLDGIWLGGVRGNTDTVLVGSDDCIIRNCTFFNYYEAVVVGAQFRLQFLSNRFVNCGTGALYHDIYYTAQPAVPADGATIKNGIHVGGEGYKIHLWHGPTYCTVQNNFCAANNGYCIAINGNGHTVDHNIGWNSWIFTASPTNTAIKHNAVGPVSAYAWALGTGCTTADNISTFPVSPVGAIPTQWLRRHWKTNTGYSVDEINDTTKKLELAFAQSTANIWIDNGIEPLFTILAAVRDAMADPGPQQGSPPPAVVDQVVRHDRGGIPLPHRHKGGRNRRRVTRSRRLTTR